MCWPNTKSIVPAAPCIASTAPRVAWPANSKPTSSFATKTQRMLRRVNRIRNASIATNISVHHNWPHTIVTGNPRYATCVAWLSLLVTLIGTKRNVETNEVRQVSKKKRNVETNEVRQVSKKWKNHVVVCLGIATVLALCQPSPVVFVPATRI